MIEIKAEQREVRATNCCQYNNDFLKGALSLIYVG